MAVTFSELSSIVERDNKIREECRDYHVAHNPALAALPPYDANMAFETAMGSPQRNIILRTYLSEFNTKHPRYRPGTAPRYGAGAGVGGLGKLVAGLVLGGAALIGASKLVDKDYRHLVAAAGAGTMLAGPVIAAKKIYNS